MTPFSGLKPPDTHHPLPCDVENPASERNIMARWGGPGGKQHSPASVSKPVLYARGSANILLTGRDSVHR